MTIKNVDQLLYFAVGLMGAVITAMKINVKFAVSLIVAAMIIII